MLWPLASAKRFGGAGHTKTFFVSNKHKTSRIVNFSYLPRISFYTICNHHLPSKAQAKDDRLSGQRINLIYTKLAIFTSRAKSNILKDFLIVCLILENQWLIFLCAFVFFVVK
jgi:hypothetical protein